MLRGKVVSTPPPTLVHVRVIRVRWWASLLDKVIEEPTTIVAPKRLEEEAHDGHSGIDPAGRHGGRLVMHQEVHRTPHLVWLRR